MRILILGATGFLGRRLLETLQKRKLEVVGLSPKDGLDLTNSESTRSHLSRIEPHVIFNCTAHAGNVHYGIAHPASMVHDNLIMTLNLYKAVLAKCPSAQIINPIPNCSYPMDAEIQSESGWWNGLPHSSALSYASARRMTYVIALGYKQEHNINSRNFICPGIYGPGDHLDVNRTHAMDGMIVRMIKAKRNHQKEFEIWGTGKPVREWCYIDDVIEVFVKSLSIKEDLIYPINIGQKKGYSIKETAHMIAEAVDFKGRLIFNTQYADVAAIKILDDQRFRQLFKDIPFTDIVIGIKKTVEYYESAL